MVAPALAGDFRVADIDGSCATIKEQEVALGSREIAGRVALVFAGRAYGRDVEIGYLCSKGTLVAGDLIFTFEKVEEAFGAFEEIHRQLTATYGAPVNDHDPWPSDSASKTLAKGLMLRTMTTWNNPRVSVTASIAARAESAGGGYLLLIHYGGTLDDVHPVKVPDSTPQVPPNTSLERTRER